MSLMAKCTWISGMLFENDNRGAKSWTDATAEASGSGKYATPKELVLNAMMGCTAMDVVAILKKMRLTIEELTMQVEAEKTEEHPIHFRTALLQFFLKGELPQDKVIKAVESSLTKYCGVNYMISQSCAITYKVFLNEKEITSGQVDFNHSKHS